MKAVDSCQTETGAKLSGLHQVKNLFFFLLLASATAAAQSNQVSVAAIGNLNPVTYVYINQVLPTMGSSQKSSLGGGAEYDHWFHPDKAFGVLYEQNPSDGKLLEGNGRLWDIWPQMRYEFLGMFTQQVRLKVKVNRFTPFVQAGAGAVVTHEDGNTYNGQNALAGWSHSLALATGAGWNYWLSPRTAIRFGSTIVATETGCYNDPTCRPTWGLSHDILVGFSWAVGRGRVGEMRRQTDGETSDR